MIPSTRGAATLWQRSWQLSGVQLLVAIDRSRWRTLADLAKSVGEGATISVLDRQCLLLFDVFRTALELRRVVAVAVDTRPGVCVTRLELVWSGASRTPRDRPTLGPDVTETLALQTLARSRHVRLHAVGHGEQLDAFR